MTAATVTGDRVRAKLSKGDWIALGGIALAQVVAIMMWGIALDRRVTIVETTVTGFAQPLHEASENNKLLVRIEQQVSDINRRMERLEEKKP